MKKENKIEKILFSLLVVLLPAQIGKHFWPKEAFVRGIRIDYLSPTLFLTDLVIIALIIFWVLDKTEKIEITASARKISGRITSLSRAACGSHPF